MRRSALLGLVIGLSLPGAIVAQDGTTRIGGVWYLNYRAGESGGESFNRFGISRGYINIRHTLNDRWSGRITPDVTVDQFGDAKVRLKYAYGDVKFGDAGILTSPHMELGLVHRPWLDFEEHLNLYRSQGTMFLERNGLFNSADFGLTFLSLLGGEVDESYQEEVSSAYPGRYGSFAIGVYNGGGYHARENNENKSIEGRLSIRPLPDALPGLQLSYLGMFGKGNTEDAPDWTVNALFASYETRDIVLTATRYFGEGNSKGSAVDEEGVALEQDGFSVFGEWKLHDPGLSILGRFDSFDFGPDTDDEKSERIIVGIAYHIQGSTKILLDYDIESGNGFDSSDNKALTVTLDFHF